MNMLQVVMQFFWALRHFVGRTLWSLFPLWGRYVLRFDFKF